MIKPFTEGHRAIRVSDKFALLPGKQDLAGRELLITKINYWAGSTLLFFTMGFSEAISAALIDCGRGIPCPGTDPDQAEIFEYSEVFF